jgi:hypothetical protein
MSSIALPTQLSPSLTEEWTLLVSPLLPPHQECVTTTRTTTLLHLLLVRVLPALAKPPDLECQVL